MQSTSQLRTRAGASCLPASRHRTGALGTLASAIRSPIGRSASTSLSNACPIPLSRSASAQFGPRSPLLRAPQRNTVIARASLSDLVPVLLFFTPGLGALVYAYFKGKGNLKDGLSRLLTEVSQGYFQPDVGGANIPVAEGELSDLAGDEPLFKALYKW
jgi:hypothetical protein